MGDVGSRSGTESAWDSELCPSLLTYVAIGV